MAAQPKSIRRITDAWPHADERLGRMFAAERVTPERRLALLVAIAARVEEMLRLVQLDGFQRRRPDQLSGGEQQRVALARAFSNRPKILFADEPTGNLDAAHAAQVNDLLFRLNQEAGTALVVVTHNEELARRVGRTLTLHAGELRG